MTSVSWNRLLLAFLAALERQPCTHCSIMFESNWRLPLPAKTWLVKGIFPSIEWPYKVTFKTAKQLASFALFHPTNAHDVRTKRFAEEGDRK